MTYFFIEVYSEYEIGGKERKKHNKFTSKEHVYKLQIKYHFHNTQLQSWV